MKTALEIKTIIQTYEEVGTIKGTARALGIAKGTVKRYLKRYKEVQNGERSRISPEDEERVIVKMRNQEYDLRLKELIEQNEIAPKAKRLTMAKMHEILVAEGWKVSYSTVKRRVREYEDYFKPRKVYIKQVPRAKRTIKSD